MASASRFPLVRSSMIHQKIFMLVHTIQFTSTQSHKHSLHSGRSTGPSPRVVLLERRVKSILALGDSRSRRLLPRLVVSMIRRPTRLQYLSIGGSRAISPTN